MISSSSSWQFWIKANKGKCWGEAPTGHQTFTKWTNRQGRGPAIEGKGTNQNSNIRFRYSTDIKFEKVSKDQSRNRIEAFGRRKHKSKDGWESGMNSQSDFNCVCFGRVRLARVKLKVGTLPISLVSLRSFCSLPTFLQASRPDCCGQIGISQ